MKELHNKLDAMEYDGLITALNPPPAWPAVPSPSWLLPPC